MLAYQEMYENRTCYVTFSYLSSLWQYVLSIEHQNDKVVIHSAIPTIM